MGWLVGKHCFSHNYNIFFFRFPLAVLFRSLRRFQDSITVPLPTVPFDSRLRNSLLGSFISHKVPHGTGRYFLAISATVLACCAAFSALGIFQKKLLLRRRQHESAMRFYDSRILFVPWVCFCLPCCSAVVTVTVGKYPPNIIPNKYFCIKISHFDNDKHYID